MRIPSVLSQAEHFEVGLEMVKPVAPRKLTLAERLEGFDPALHGGEAMAAGLTGGETF